MKNLTATEFHCWAKRKKVNNKYSNKTYFPLVKIESHISFSLLFFCYILCEEIAAYVNAHKASRILRIFFSCNICDF
jgi:hypothetical protein